MSQQPYYPQAPQPQQFAQPVPQQQQYAPAPPQAYAQPPMQQYAPQAQTPPAQPLADGSIDAFYAQPIVGGGPGISWKGKPDGYTVQGIVPRDVVHADVTQEVGAPNTREAGVPQFYRDGRPKFVMAVPLQVPVSQEFPEGEAKLYVRGQLRDELTRAMGEAGVQGAPAAGAVITVTLVQRKPGRGTIPQNIFAINYTPAGGQPPAVQQAPAQQQYAQPVPQQQYAPAQPAQQAPAPQQTQQFVQQPMQQAPVQEPVQQYAPQQASAPQAPQAAQSAMSVPPGLDPQQAALLAKLTGGQQA